MTGSAGICCGRAKIGTGSSILTASGNYTEIGNGHLTVAGFNKDLYRSGKGWFRFQLRSGTALQLFRAVSGSISAGAKVVAGFCFYFLKPLSLYH